MEENLTEKVLTESERRELTTIDAAVKRLLEAGWRAVKYEVSERHFMSSDDTLHSLKLELLKGPMTISG